MTTGRCSPRSFRRHLRRFDPGPSLVRGAAQITGNCRPSLRLSFERPSTPHYGFSSRRLLWRWLLGRRSHRRCPFITGATDGRPAAPGPFAATSPCPTGKPVPGSDPWIQPNANRALVPCLADRRLITQSPLRWNRLTRCHWPRFCIPAPRTGRRASATHSYGVGN